MTHRKQEEGSDKKTEFQPVVLPNLKPTTASISLRLPRWLLERLKQLANGKDVPYQSLMKVYLSERVEVELRKHLGGANPPKQAPEREGIV